MEAINLAVLLGTTRKERKSIHVAKLIHEIADKQPTINSTLVDPDELDLPKDGNDPSVKDEKYSKITKNADAFFIVVPEYNHSFPGSLKRMLDSELDNYIHKPVAFAGVSAGPWGGVRAIENLVPAVREMGMVATFTDVQFPNVGSLFSKKGKLEDEDYKKRVKKTLKELLWMATVLRYGRENIPSKYHQDS